MKRADFLCADILTYDDVLAAAPGENGEPIVEVPRGKTGLLLSEIPAEKVPLCGPRHVLREDVVQRLVNAAAMLNKEAPGHSLLLLSSYRNPDYQTRWHEEIKDELRKRSPELSELEISRAANQQVAAPEVAGHPCGAAVDVTIVGPKGELPMGSDYLDFTDPELFKVFSEKIGPNERLNRELLRTVMLSQGFAPFNGEWWHFSYGDREWAVYFELPSGIYSAVVL